MTERRGTKALELWCRRVTEGYPGVNVCNMTTSWRDGLAFCALIHRFRPDLIDFASLRPGQARHNNELAFTTAERHLGIPALLDAEDMVDSHAPDRLSVLTYLAQYYQAFGQASLAMGIISPGRSTTTAKRPDGGGTNELPSPRTPEEKQTKKVWNLPREPCVFCGLPVFLAERLKLSGRTFHRTCFKCARCGTQLSTANCYETESHAFCCEVCPDEEAAERGGQREVKNRGEPVLLESSSDDEADSASVGGSYDEYSSNFETVLESQETPTLPHPALSAFLNTQLAAADDDPVTVTSSPDLPTISNVNIKKEATLENLEENAQNSINNHSDGDLVNCSKLIKNDFDDESQSGLVNATDLKLCDSEISALKTASVNSKVEDSSLCSSSLEVKSSGELSATSSLVSRRRSLFENLTQSDETPSQVRTVITRKLSQSSAQEDTSSTSNDRNLVKHNDVVNNDDSLNPFLESSNISGNVSKAHDVETLDEDVNESHKLPNEDATVSISNLETPDQTSETTASSDVEIKYIDEDIEVKSSDKVEEVIDQPNVVESQQPEVKPTVDISGTGSPTVTTAPLNEDVIESTQLDNVSPAAEVVKPVLPATVEAPVNEDVIESTQLDNISPADNVPPAAEVVKPVLPATVEAPVIENVLESTQQKDVPAVELVTPTIVVIDEEKYPDDLNPFGDDDEPRVKSPSTNPFSSDEEEEEPVLRKVQPAPRKVIPVDAHLNPFWEEGDEEDEKPVPVPRPRSLRSPEVPRPAPRRTLPASPSPSAGKKKSPAPPPPPSPATMSPAPSPRNTLRPARKSRPAPPPPSKTSPDVERLLQLGEKGIKDELNRTRQGLVAERKAAPEKSHQGQWKRKKGPAPALPIPPRRQLKVIPMAEVRQELDMIETQQRGLEKQGVRLESHIRDQLEQLGCEADAESLPPEVEEQVLQLFELVNEKNELFRRQAELMYLKRQQRLEEQQAELEWQIRCLLQQPKRGEAEVQQEEELIARLVAVVEQRNEIVDCLEMDRKREADEDKSVRERLQMISDRQNQPAEEVPKSKSKKSKLRLLHKDKSKKSTKKEDKNATKKEEKNAAKKEEKKKDKKNAAASSTLAVSTSQPDTPEQAASQSPGSAKKHKKKWFS